MHAQKKMHSSIFSSANLTRYRVLIQRIKENNHYQLPAITFPAVRQPRKVYLFSCSLTCRLLYGRGWGFSLLRMCECCTLFQRGLGELLASLSSQHHSRIRIGNAPQ
jgi:hypothetical protein